jgi:hypothetical protein
VTPGTYGPRPDTYISAVDGGKAVVARVIPAARRQKNRPYGLFDPWTMHDDLAAIHRSGIAVGF